jgi:hypothetical protein
LWSLGDGGKIFAVNPDGTEKWMYQTGYAITSDPAIGDDGTVYIGSGDDYLYALYPNGTLQWRFKTGHYVQGPPSIADDDTIYVGSWDDYLYALYPNGTMKWKCKVGAGTKTNPSIASDGTIFVGGQKLYAVNPDGSMKWTFDMGPGRHNADSSPAISADGTIYVGTNINEVDGGDIIAVNPDGTEKWRKRIANDWVDSSPCIDEDGTVYIGSSSDKLDKNGYVESVGYLHAFGEVESNIPPTKPTMTGRLKGWTLAPIYYGFSTIDPDNNPVSFYVEWGDGALTNWTGGGYDLDMDEAASGEIVYLEHSYLLIGKYTIKAKARDVFGGESDWATLEVSMPKHNDILDKQVNNITISIQGGLGIKIEICNHGNTTLYLVNWSITIDGPLVILGRSISGSISEIPPGECVTIETMFIIGIGPITITIQIGDTIVSSNGYLIGPFVLLK